MRVRVAVAGLTAMGAVLVPAQMAGADGGKGRSFCSDSGPPTGMFVGDIYNTESYGNAGEVVSWFSQRDTRPGPWGQTVKQFCDPKAP